MVSICQPGANWALAQILTTQSLALLIWSLLLTKTNSWTPQDRNIWNKIKVRKIFWGLGWMGRITGDLSYVGNCWSGFAHSSTWQLSDAPNSAVWRNMAVRRCGESWHTVTVTLSQMRQQELPRPWGPRTQDLLKTQIVGSKRLGSLKLIGRVICWKRVAFCSFLCSCFLTRPDVWVVNPNGQLICCPGPGHLIRSERPFPRSIW